LYKINNIRGWGMLISIGSKEEKVVTSATHYISMSQQVYADLMSPVDHYSTEVSGCGLVERIEHRSKGEFPDDPDIVEIEFKITEVYLPHEQDNTGATTDISDEAINKLMLELLKLGKNTEHLRLHWHSHANMETFHSGTDEDNYATLSHGEFLVSLVINKAHNILGRIDYFTPIRVTMTGVSVYLDIEESNKPSHGISESIKKLDEYVNAKPKTVITTWVKGKKVVTYLDSPSWEQDRENVNSTGIVPANGRWIPPELDEADVDAADMLGIAMWKAKQYKTCSTFKCEACKDVQECEEFRFNSGNYSV
jgi:hypothetical protein